MPPNTNIIPQSPPEDLPAPQPANMHSAFSPSPPHSYSPPEQHQPPAKLESTATDQPIPVIEVLSVRGVEYVMMTIALWIGAITLAWVVLNMLNGSRGFNYVIVPTSALVICVPVFGLFFLRLKRAELADPSLKFDPSKRRWSQITQILAYTAVLINLMYFVYIVLQHTSGGSKTSITKALLNLVVILVVAGGVLTYYWFDEHRLIKK